MIDRNDPRLTAFALGEMDAAEQAEFEKMLASDPAVRAEVEAIRALGGRIRADFARSPAPALTEAQRASVTKAARRRVPLAILLMPVAACLVGAAAYFFTREPVPSLAPAQRVAELDHRRRLDDREHQRSQQEAAIRATPTEPTQGFQGPNGGVPPGIREADEAPAFYAEDNSPNRRDPSDPEAPPPSDPGASAEPARSPEKNKETAVERPDEAAAKPEETPSVPAATERMSDGRVLHVEELAEALPAPTTVNTAIGLGGRAGGDTGGGAGKAPDAMKRLPVVDRWGELRTRPEHNREAYDRIRDNPFIRVAEEDSSTFSIDVDTASYANVRRFLAQHQLPPPDAVRVEEMINYFSYAYEPPVAGSPDPFRVHLEVAACPWDATHRLARVAIKGKTIDHRERGASNLVFLVDVSGSMNEPAKLPLVQASLRMLAENLGSEDRVAITVYAGAAGLVLPSTGDKRQVIDAIERLQAGGSTAGAAGIELAYQVAAENFIKGGTNRVILCTDGDFNVGVTDNGALTRMIEEKAKSGVFLSVLGYGTGNYQDAKMQQLADKGNGNHAYIDSILEARKVLGEEMSGTLVTIAKDVKIQLFFNPKKVAAFRLIGYENRLLAKQDFNDDTKDAGEIGAGHCVTALYELVPAGSEVPGRPAVDRNPFVPKAEAAVDVEALFQLRLRYKRPDGDKSDLIEAMVRDGNATFDAASPDFRWASAVAAFGMNLRGTAGMGLDAVKEIAKGAAGDDKYRREFLDLVETAKLLSR